MPGTYVQVKARVANRVCRRGYLSLRILQRRTCCNRIWLPSAFTAAFLNRTEPTQEGIQNSSTFGKSVTQSCRPELFSLMTTAQRHRLRQPCAVFRGNFILAEAAIFVKTKCSMPLIPCHVPFWWVLCAVVWLTGYSIGFCPAFAGELSQIIDDV